MTISTYYNEATYSHPPLREKPRLQDSVRGIMPSSKPPSMQWPVPTPATMTMMMMPPSEDLSSSSASSILHPSIVGRSSSFFTHFPLRPRNVWRRHQRRGHSLRLPPTCTVFCLIVVYLWFMVDVVVCRCLVSLSAPPPLRRSRRHLVRQLPTAVFHFCLLKATSSSHPN